MAISAPKHGGSASQPNPPAQYIAQVAHHARKLRPSRPIQTKALPSAVPGPPPYLEVRRTRASAATAARPCLSRAVECHDQAGGGVSRRRVPSGAQNKVRPSTLVGAHAGPPLASLAGRTCKRGLPGPMAGGQRDAGMGRWATPRRRRMHGQRFGCGRDDAVPSRVAWRCAHTCVRIRMCAGVVLISPGAACGWG